ncbi:hypothetical protein PSHT_08912 [Puccinia striiformis]|uniref:AB hydrolase-1 domain-containing protein n=1 Tax=Puccinia striiformis TaxID=27350 RepID=A0A2S4VK94_9BASI|nr:hypothetical protein PSHT_08912 [Puccinia striiformis]
MVEYLNKINKEYNRFQVYSNYHPASLNQDDGNDIRSIVDKECPSIIGPNAFFSPTPCGHLQTIYSAIGNFSKIDRVEYERRMIRVKDGGQISIDMSPPLSFDSGEEDSRPVLVVLHGLTGGSHESYVRSLLHPLISRFGWRAVVVNFRGCAHTPLLTPKLYNAGATEDIRVVISYLKKKVVSPDVNLHAIGFSLGANVLTKYLGEEQDRSVIKSAVVVGNPWDLIYSRALASNLRGLMKRHIHNYKTRKSAIDVGALYSNPNQSLYEFDSIVTKSLGGFKSTESYYKSQSSTLVVNQIRIPVLSINARDDPIVSLDSIPVHNVLDNPFLMVLHLGWFEGVLNPRRMIDRPITEWFVAMNKHTRSQNIADVVNDDVLDDVVGVHKLGVLQGSCTMLYCAEPFSRSSSSTGASKTLAELIQIERTHEASFRAWNLDSLAANQAIHSWALADSVDPSTLSVQTQNNYAIGIADYRATLKEILLSESRLIIITREREILTKGLLKLNKQIKFSNHHHTLQLQIKLDESKRELLICQQQLKLTSDNLYSLKQHAISNALKLKLTRFKELGANIQDIATQAILLIAKLEPPTVEQHQQSSTDFESCDEDPVSQNEDPPITPIKKKIPAKVIVRGRNHRATHNKRHSESRLPHQSILRPRSLSLSRLELPKDLQINPPATRKIDKTRDSLNSFKLFSKGMLSRLGGGTGTAVGVVKKGKQRKESRLSQSQQKKKHTMKNPSKAGSGPSSPIIRRSLTEGTSSSIVPPITTARYRGQGRGRGGSSSWGSPATHPPGLIGRHRYSHQKRATDLDDDHHLGSSASDYDDNHDHHERRGTELSTLIDYLPENEKVFRRKRGQEHRDAVAALTKHTDTSSSPPRHHHRGNGSSSPSALVPNHTPPLFHHLHNQNRLPAPVLDDDILLQQQPDLDPDQFVQYDSDLHFSESNIDGTDDRLSPGYHLHPSHPPHHHQEEETETDAQNRGQHDRIHIDGVGRQDYPGEESAIANLSVDRKSGLNSLDNNNNNNNK